MRKYSSADKISVGVVGYGGAFNMARAHLEQARAAGMVPTAVAEIDAARREVARKDFPGIEVYRNAAEMYRKSNVRLVSIITPHYTHAKLAVQALNAGRHVVTEKPMALTTAECDRMIAVAKRNRCLLSAYHNRHWDGCIMQAVKTIQKGTIGEVVRICASIGRHGKPTDTWRGSRSISGGILYDFGAHFVEYALQILDGEISEVSGFAHHGAWAATSPWGADANEDDAFALVRFSSGQHLALNVTSLDSNASPYWLEITGTRGSYLFNGEIFEQVLPKGTGVQRTTGRNPQGDWKAYYRNIADFLTKKAPLVITAEWARRPIHVLDLAIRSAKAGKTLKARYG